MTELREREDMYKLSTYFLAQTAKHKTNATQMPESINLVSACVQLTRMLTWAGQYSVYMAKKQRKLPCNHWVNMLLLIFIFVRSIRFL